MYTIGLINRSLMGIRQGWKELEIRGCMPYGQLTAVSSTGKVFYLGVTIQLTTVSNEW